MDPPIANATRPSPKLRHEGPVFDIWTHNLPPMCTTLLHPPCTCDLFAQEMALKSSSTLPDKTSNYKPSIQSQALPINRQNWHFSLEPPPPSSTTSTWAFSTLTNIPPHSCISPICCSQELSPYGYCCNPPLLLLFLCFILLNFILSVINYYKTYMLKYIIIPFLCTLLTMQNTCIHCWVQKDMI